MKISDAVYTLINPDHFIQFLHICKRSRNRRNATMITQVITLEYNIGSLVEGMDKSVLIDTGCGIGDLKAYVATLTGKPITVLLTHGHLDHNFGNPFISKTYGLPLEIDSSDAALVRATEKQAALFGITLNEPMDMDIKMFHMGDRIKFGSHEIEVIETPGHSMGSVVLYIKDEKLAFTGDTLFRGSIGRTDFEGGSMLMIIQSLRMFVQFPDDIRLLPGHGQETTMGYELAHNPYLDR